MNRRIKLSWAMYAGLSILLIALALGGCTKSTTDLGPLKGTNYTVGIGTTDKLGDYLIEQNGKALYYYTKDTVGTSNVSGVLLDVWPAFYAENLNLPDDLDPANFGTITRRDGKEQTTYNGWPLYSYAADTGPGDTRGDGVEGIWFVVKVPFYTTMVASKADVGTYLTDPRGMTLYRVDFDSNGKSNATSAVLAVWPIFSQSNFIVPSSLNPADFGTTTTNGQVQATYKGWPLYYFANDKAPGQTLGQGVKNVWFVVAPDVTSAPSVPKAPLP